ncbi:MAG: hypothetical protein K2M05_06620 [Paramuribaculum sp.]|nr:hypothetical protein [Paramuribaculum sp.]MDE6303430.1 hypothetical protein [Paramuribaculum sp.]
MDDFRGSLKHLKAKIDEAQIVDISSIKVGDIIYVPLDEDDGLTLTNGYNTRNKYIVIIGFTPEGIALGALLINSDINPAKRSPEMMNCQYPMLMRHYPSILRYDSWLDCSDIFELSKEKISERKGKLKGCLTTEDKDRILDFLRETDLFDNVTKRRFGLL